MKKSSVILVILLFFSLGIFAQKSESKKTVKENGWNLASIQKLFDENSQITRAKVKIESENSEIAVDLEHIAVKSKLSFELQDFFTDEKISKWNNTTRPVIYVVQKYSLNNKTFAYLIKFKYQLISDNSISYAGCLSESSYVDENGDGKFETLTETQNEKIGFVPSWVLE